jgi:hypothetical protein
MSLVQIAFCLELDNFEFKKSTRSYNVSCDKPHRLLFCRLYFIVTVKIAIKHLHAVNRLDRMLRHNIVETLCRVQGNVCMRFKLMLLFCCRRILLTLQKRRRPYVWMCLNSVVCTICVNLNCVRCAPFCGFRFSFTVVSVF